MSRRKHRGSGEDSSEIDLTPMLDVVFIMLIFFIVTASFLKEKGLDVNIPPENDQPPPPDAPRNILITVTASNEIWVDNRRVDVRAVRSLIDRKFAENRDASVVISADGESDAETYIAIADAARGAKIPPYKITLKPQLN